MSAVALGAAAGVAMLFFFPPDQYGFYPRCLFHYLTGWQCPGCGGLRAMHCLLHGDISGAFHFNQLMVLMLPVVALIGIGWIMRSATGTQTLPELQRPFFLWLLIALAIGFGIGRNLALL